jgi:hypothetical protein
MMKIFISEERDKGKANATINRGIQALKSAFHLAKKEGIL